MTITPVLLAFLLIFVRVLAVIGSAPVIGNAQIPAFFKIGLAFFIALLIDNTMTQTAIHTSMQGVTIGSFVALLVIEALTGLAIGLIASTAFAITQFAGELLDQQVGFSIATIISPGMTSPGGLLSNFYYLVFALWFLSVNGHYAILLALLQSFHIIPLGSATLYNGALSNTFLQALISFMIMGLQFAAPVLLALFLTNVSLAVASRAVPQMNVFVVGLPISLLIGLLFVAMFVPDAVNAMQGILNSMENALSQVLQGLGGVK